MILSDYKIPSTAVLLCLSLVLALGAASCTKRKPEEIDYAPDSPFSPYPPDSATNIDHTTTDVTLRWAATDPNSGDALTYDLYFDTLNPPENKLASSLTEANYFIPGLAYNTTYYWKLYITDDKGAVTTGPVWRFTTLPHANRAPDTPVYLYPADLATAQYPTLYLAAGCTDPEGDTDTLYYDLYLGQAIPPPVTLYRNDTNNRWLCSGLDYSSTYHWKLAVHDNHGAYTYGPVYSFSTRTCPWVYRSALPSARCGFGTAVVNNKIYVIGGTDGLNALSEVLEYDPVLDSWTRKADMPTARTDLGVTVWQNMIYAMGGHDGDTKCAQTEVYDPLLNSWTSLTPAPGGASWSTASTLSDRIYLIGNSFSMGSIFTGVFEYSPASDTWWDTTYVNYDTLWEDSTYFTIDTSLRHTDLRTEIPTSRVFHAAAVWGEKIYVMGGVDANSSFPARVDVYDPATNLWSTAADLFGPATAPATTVANGCIYAIGGYTGGYPKYVRKYDPVADAWFIRSDFQQGRAFLGAAAVNGRIYAIGGMANIPLSTVEEYRLELDSKDIRK